MWHLKILVVMTKLKQNTFFQEAYERQVGKIKMFSYSSKCKQFNKRANIKTTNI